MPQYYAERLIRCSACHFRCHDPTQDLSDAESLSRLYVYEFAPGRIAPVLETRGFCASCDAVTLIESLPTPAAIEEYLEGLDSLRRTQYQLDNHIKVQIRAGAPHWREWAIKCIRRPRCLKCTANAVILTPKHPEVDFVSDDKGSCYKHTDCTGTLRVFEGQIRHPVMVPLSLTTIIISPAGKRLTRLPVDDSDDDDVPEGTEQTVEVWVIDPKGDYTTTWVIGQEVPIDVYEKAYDKLAECIYAMTTYDEGAPKTHVLSRELWLKAKALLRRVDPGDA